MLFNKLIIFICFLLNISTVLAIDLKFMFGTQDSGNEGSLFDWSEELKQGSDDIQLVGADAMRHIGVQMKTGKMPSFAYFYPGQKSASEEGSLVFVRPNCTGCFDHYLSGKDKIMTYSKALDNAHYEAGNVDKRTTFTEKSGVSTFAYLAVQDGWDVSGTNLTWKRVQIPSVTRGDATRGGAFRSVDSGGYGGANESYRGSTFRSVDSGGYGEANESYRGSTFRSVDAGKYRERNELYSGSSDEYESADREINDCKLMPSDEKTKNDYPLTSWDSIVGDHPILGFLASKKALVVKYITFQVLDSINKCITLTVNYF